MEMKKRKLLMYSQCRSFWIIWSDSEAAYVHTRYILFP